MNVKYHLAPEAGDVCVRHADQIQNSASSIQVQDIPEWLMSESKRLSSDLARMVPYVITIIALSLYAWRMVKPRWK